MTTETNAALEQAQAKASSIVRMVAALECDFDRLEELRELKKECAFVAGWNMAGYMPDGDHIAFDNFEDARVYIIDELSEQIGQEDEAGNKNLCDLYREAVEHVEQQSGPFSFTVNHHAWFVQAGALPSEDAKELAELEEAANGCADQEEAQQVIKDDPLSVDVRSDWQSAGETLTASEFRILLCTGSPAVQIVGELDEHLQPCRAWIEFQDWGTRWTHLVDCPASQYTLLAYCQQFYFGE